MPCVHSSRTRTRRRSSTILRDGQLVTPHHRGERHSAPRTGVQRPRAEHRPQHAEHDDRPQRARGSRTDVRELAAHDELPATQRAEQVRAEARVRHRVHVHERALPPPGQSAIGGRHADAAVLPYPARPQFPPKPRLCRIWNWFPVFSVYLEWLARKLLVVRCLAIRWPISATKFPRQPITVHFVFLFTLFCAVGGNAFSLLRSHF